MLINDAGLALLKSCESCELKAYPDPGTGADPWTIGYGHTGDDVYEGLEWTQEQADEALKDDVGRFERGVESCVKVSITDNQFSALVCFAFNVGLGNFRISHLLSKLNYGDIDGAANEFLRWNKAGGRVLPGLTSRRQKERDLFLT